VAGDLRHEFAQQAGVLIDHLVSIGPGEPCRGAKANDVGAGNVLDRTGGDLDRANERRCVGEIVGFAARDRRITTDQQNLRNDAAGDEREGECGSDFSESDDGDFHKSDCDRSSDIAQMAMWHGRYRSSQAAMEEAGTKPDSRPRTLPP
jgi:hypothetical protein